MLSPAPSVKNVDSELEGSEAASPLPWLPSWSEGEEEPWGLFQPCLVKRPP